jgi:hypothetical protein
MSLWTETRLGSGMVNFILLYMGSSLYKATWQQCMHTMQEQITANYFWQHLRYCDEDVAP